MKSILTSAMWLIAKVLMLFDAILSIAKNALSYFKPLETLANELIAMLADYGQSKIDRFNSKTTLDKSKSASIFTEDFEHRNFA